MIPVSRHLFVPVLLTASLIGPAVGAVASAPGRRTGAVPGNTPPGLARATLVGHAAPGRPLAVTLALDLRDRRGAEAFVAAQHDPGSSLYNRWITPQEFQARFGPLPEDLQAAEDFLASHGFTNIRRPASRLVTGTGTVAAAEAAFGVTINDYLYNGRPVYANDRDPVLPAGLASKTVRVGGLDSLTRRYPTYRSSGGTLYHTHRDWAYAYGETSTFDAGDKGAPGGTIAIAGSYRVDVTRLNDIFTREGGAAFGYQAWTEAASGPRTIFQVCDVTGSVQGSKGCDLNDSGSFNSLEAQLDAVMISSTANDAHLVNHMVENQLIDSFTIMDQIIADDPGTKVVSTSWGLCVGSTPDSAIANDDAVFLQADAAGQAWFAATGDLGSNDCGGTPNPDTDWPATSSHVTGAGGSSLTDNFDANGWNQGYSTEIACADGGGGIPSKSGPIYDRPAWQAGPGVPAGTKRLVPDVSAHFGTCTGAANASYAVTLGSFIFQASGTSAVAPMWAGAWAVGNQVVGQNMGHAAPLLYRILRGENGTSYSTAFNDVTIGSNGAYSAGAGYDLTTGIGTPNWNGLFADLGLLFTVSTGNLDGTVTDGATGAPVAGATVTTSGTAAETTTTSASGFYSFTNIPTGMYSVTASGPGYASSTATGVTITTGGTTTQDFALAENLSGCLADTTASDFQAGVATAVDLASSPGDVRLASSGGGVETLDQQQNTLGVSGDTITTTSWQAQSFVPGITGNLTKLDVHMFCSGCSGTNPDVIVDVRTTSGGLPTGTILASATIPGFGSGSDGLYSTTFNAPASLVTGTTYAFVLRLATNRTTGSYAATRSNNDQYAGGARIVSTDGGSTWTAQGTDLGFHTYMTPPLVYVTSGSLVSSPRDANPVSTGIPHWTSLSWTATTPAGTSVSFQLATSNSPTGPFVFVGPDGTSGTFFTTSPAALPAASFAGRYLEYKALLGTTDTSRTPVIADVTVCYDNTCLGLADGTACDDGDACTTADTCQAGACLGGPPPDQDGDTHVAAACGGDDCNDMDATVWSAPVEVTMLTVTGANPDDLAWDAQGSLVGPGTSYDLVTGSMSGGAGLDYAAGTCLLPGGGTGFSDTRADPPAGDAWWYLARARNACGIGTWGDALRDGGISACP